MYTIVPDKLKNQHILVDPAVISEVVRAASPTKQDRVLEIGGGSGNLTEAIAAYAGTVYAIEKDPAYASELEKRFSGDAHVRVMAGDALNVKLPEFNKIVSNPPYRILQPFFLRLLRERKQNFSVCVVVVPYGFSKLAAAAPGSSDFGVLSAFFYSFYDVEVITKVQKGAFRPEPKVMSCILRIAPKANGSALSAMLRLIFLEDQRKIRNAMLDALWNYGERIIGQPMTKNRARDMVLEAERAGGLENIFEKHILQLNNMEISRLAASMNGLLDHAGH